jgi:hypothetical protein
VTVRTCVSVNPASLSKPSIIHCSSRQNLSPLPLEVFGHIPVTKFADEGATGSWIGTDVDDQADPTEQSQADTIFNLVIVSLLVSFVVCVLPHLGMLTRAGNPNVGRQRGQEGRKGLNANLISTSPPTPPT